MNASPHCAPLWPRLSVASALLPLIRRALLDARDALGVSPPDAEVLPILEDRLLGYEIAPRAVEHALVAIGCTDDAIARIRSTEFETTNVAPLRLATVHGVPIDNGRQHTRRMRQHETLYADWPTAASDAWRALAGIAAGAVGRWEESMTACRSLENALTIAALHLAEWDPAVDFFGLPHQSEYGVPLRGEDGDSGSLTLHRPDAWLLYWRARGHIVQLEWSRHSVPEDIPAALPRDVKR